MRTPSYSVSQKIGNLGKRVFLGGHPDSWFTESEPIQGADFGFDMSMWLENLGEIQGRFSVQLKSGANTTFAGPESNRFVQVDLTPEVCNLFLQDGQPVLLVFVDLRDEKSSDDAEMYYLWIEAELKNRLKDRKIFDESDPGEMTFRVPVTNKLTKNLDFSKYLETYWDHTRIANRLRSAEGTAALGTVSALSPKSISALTSLSPRSLDRWLANESLAGTEENLWPTPKSGTSVAKLKQIAEYLNHGNAAEADRIIDELNLEKISDREILAELRYQEGRRSFLDGNARSALIQFSSASMLQPDTARYCAAELEAAVADSIASSQKLSADLLAKADRLIADEEVRFQLVRIATIDGNHSKAEDLLASLSEPNRTKAEALYFAIRNDWPAVLLSTSHGLSEKHSTRTRNFLKILRLRALLHNVTGGQSDTTIGGRPDLVVSDVEILRDATIESLRDSQASGWPANSEMILDCAAVTCIVLGPDRDLLNLLSDFAEKRPNLRYAQETLARVATFIGEPSTAISAIKKIIDPDPANIARLVLLLSESGAHAEAVDVALTNLLNASHETLIDIAVAMAAVSAYRLGSSSEEVKLRAFVASGDFAAQSLLRFISESIKSPEQREANLDLLWADATQGYGNEILQDNLLQYLQPDRDTDADRILDISKNTASRRNLTEMEAAKFSAALLKRERFEDLISFTERAQKFYPNNETIGLTRAIALEKLGQPSAAENVLRRFDKSVRTDLVSARTQLLLRIGDVEALVSLTKRALAASTQHADRFHYQRALTTLYSRKNRSQYLESVWRLGEIADREVETEEGAFLLHFLMATAASDVEVSQSRIEEFQERANRFTEKFPTSAILQVGHISDYGNPEELLSQLNKMNGITEERALYKQKARTFGERSGSHIPFSFRPRAYAPYASNIVDLLRSTINAWPKNDSSKIIVGGSEFPLSSLSLPPILDLVTVFALVELGLFKKLFSIWGVVAIPKESVKQLSELMFSPLDFGNSDLIEDVAEAIRCNHAVILQPSTPADADESFPHGELATIKSEVTSKRYEYLTLDLASALILSLDKSIAGHCRTLWDFLQAAEAEGALTCSDATLVRLRVASWNTKGTPLQPADIVAASLGASSDACTDEDSPAARAVTKFFTAKDLHQCLKDTSTVLVELAMSQHRNHQEAARWITRLFYREALLARSIGFNGTTDHLTAQLAVISVLEVHEFSDAQAIMQLVWQTLEKTRTTFGGSLDENGFFRLLAKRAAILFDGIVKKHGLEAISVEAKFTDILFSLATPGTQDRSILEDAYFEETRKLQQ